MAETLYIFSGFRFYPGIGRLRKDDDSIALRRKTSAMLERLLANPNRLVSREDLLDSVWHDTNINEEGLTNCIFEARRALGDDPRRPRYIETVHGRGYRFIAPVSTALDDPEQKAAPTVIMTGASPLVGREKELELLADRWQMSLTGRRGLVTISGEQGVGKSVLADHLLTTVQSSGLALVGRGQCFARNINDAPYLPIFEILGQICRGIHGLEVRETLTRFAPGWTSQMPEIFGAIANGVQRDLPPAIASASMLRELATTLEMLSITRPILLICEDLHLADDHTIEFLAYLAQRRETANLLVVGTFRSASERDQPYLHQVLGDLRSKVTCVSLELKGLSQEAIAQYLRRRLSDCPVLESIARQLLVRTGGNPMLVTQLADDLVARAPKGAIALRWSDEAHKPRIPKNVQLLIEHQLRSLSEVDRRMLSAASVGAASGGSLSAAVVCAALADPEFSTPESVEARLDALAGDDRLLRASPVVHWPDGTCAGGYSFSCSLYQEVLYTSINSGNRARMHMRIAERLERGWRGHLSKVRNELAMHYERGGEHAHAARHQHPVPRTATVAGTLRHRAVGYG